MNKVELVKAIAVKTGFSQKDVKEVMTAAQDVIFTEMASEGEVKVFDGVTLSGVHQDTCTRRNPQTGEPIEVPAKTVPKCKFGTVVKNAINE